MAEAQRADPLAGLTLPGRHGSVDVRAAAPLARLVLRGEAAALGDAFGPPLPQRPCRAERSSGRAALWLGPDEWLLLADAAEGRTMAAALKAHLAGKAASVVDVSHRNVGLIVDGPRATALLAAGCPLDLDAAAFPPGMCARTLFGSAEIVLWRTAPLTFHIEVWRSFVPYVVGLLGEAARDCV